MNNRSKIDFKVQIHYSSSTKILNFDFELGHTLFGDHKGDPKSRGEYFRVGGGSNDFTFLRVHDAGHMVRNKLQFSKNYSNVPVR